MLNRVSTPAPSAASVERRLSSAWALFVGLGILLVLMLLPTSWNGNEENYFQLAYRSVAPEHFGDGYAAFDQSRARFAAEHLVGMLVAAFGYEHAHQGARVGMALFYAAGLTFLFRAMRLSLLDALLVVLVFWSLDEQLIGGEWLFRGIEAKTLAYGVLFFAFGCVRLQRWRSATVLGAVALYLHFLVGGFWSVVILALQALRTGGDKTHRQAWAKNVGLFVLLALPLLWIIANDQLHTTLGPDAIAQANRIYADIRNPHHIAPFHVVHAFWSWTTGTVADIALVVLLTVFVRRRVVGPEGHAALLASAYLLAALALAFADRHTLHFSKFYLFRPSALALFLAIAALTAALKDGLTVGGQHTARLVSLAVLTPLVWMLVKGQVDTARRKPVLPDRGALVAAVNADTRPGDIVLIDPADEMNPDLLRLHRDIERPTYVNWKFVPTNPPEILRWYDAIQRRADIYAHGCSAPLPVAARYLVTLKPASLAHVRNCGPVVWQHGDLALVKVEPPFGPAAAASSAAVAEPAAEE